MPGKKNRNEILILALTNLDPGVIMNTEGYVTTNVHIIKDADEIFVTLADVRQTEAMVVCLDLDTDLAVLHVDLDNLSTIDIG